MPFSDIKQQLSLYSIWFIININKYQWSARDDILNGADYDNLVFRTELLYNKIYDSPCENCRVTFEGKYVIDD